MKKCNFFKKFYWLLIGLFIIITVYSGTNVQASTYYSQINTNLIVLFNDNIDTNVENFISNAGGKILNKLPDIGGLEVECNSKLIPKIQSYNTVKSVAPNHIISINQKETINFQDYIKTKISENKIYDNIADSDLYNTYQWDIKRITNNGKSFNLSTGNHNIVIGIIDSGVDKNHPDLAQNFMGGENFVPKDFNENKSESGNLNDIDDTSGHGTYVTGNIAANGKIKGVAPNIGFKSYRIFDSKNSTNAIIVSSAIIKATNDGVNVINLSMSGYDLKGKCYWTDPDTKKVYNLGNDMAEYGLYKRAIKYALKHNVVVVTAAGNDGIDCSNTSKLTQFLNSQNSKYGFKYEGLTYEVPGTIKGVINVSATGINDKIASYSNYGKHFIDVAAPGGNLPDLCLSTGITSSGYAFGEGTSIAAPKVSAIAGLILCENSNLKPKKVAKIIYKACDTLDKSKLNKYYGHGLVNAYTTLMECKKNKSNVITDNN